MQYPSYKNMVERQHGTVGDIIRKSSKNVFGFFFKDSDVELSSLNGVQLRISESVTWLGLAQSVTIIMKMGQQTARVSVLVEQWRTSCKLVYSDIKRAYIYNIE